MAAATLFALLCVFLLESSLAYPHYLSFFNVAAGGSQNGPKFLLHSNFDWGQDLKRLGLWVRRYNAEPLCMSYFGRGDPIYYQSVTSRMMLLARQFLADARQDRNRATQLSSLAWALPLQVILLFSNLDLLDPWGDEWFTLTTVPEPLNRIASILAGIDHPPLHLFLVHFCIGLPLASTLIAKLRSVSALWAILATVIVYAFWLRSETPRTQRMFLALWVLSPCLLLHARMARSYSMQLALAPLAIYAALCWLEQPRNRWRFLACVCSSGALLYTHYLSGLAVAAAVWLTLLWRRRFAAALAQIALLAVLYVPWIPAFIDALGSWTREATAGEGSLVTDQLVRLAYLFVSFAFGETVSTLTFVLAVILAPILIYISWLAAREQWRAQAGWLPLAGVY